jgi:carboxypeptidase Q
MKTSILINVGMVLATGSVAAGQQNFATNSGTGTSRAADSFPPRARQLLEAQKAALRAAYFEFSEISRGTLTNWDYGVAPTFSACFEGSRFYRHEIQGPGYEYYENESAFDGTMLWRRNTGAVTKTPLADALGLMNSRFVQWPYLDAAGIYAPQYLSEFGQFASLEPLVLHYLERNYPTQVEEVDGKLRVTFQVEDALADIQQLELGTQPRHLKRKAPDSKHGVVKTLNVAKPTRIVVLLLDPKYAYGMVERDDWNVTGQRTGHIRCDNWKLYEGVGIWLPSQCVASYYARPRIFASDFSEQPIHTVTNELKLVEFGVKNFRFAFDQTQPSNHIFALKATSTPRTTKIAISAQEKANLATVERIKSEVLEHSQVMDIASWLTDVYGPRLTGTPQTQAAADWAVAKMRSWGLGNVHLEPWGPYHRGWTSEKFAFRAIAPQQFTINAVPAVWSPSSRGCVAGLAIRFDVHSFVDMQQYAGRLKNAFLLIDPPRPTPAHFEPLATRLSDARLAVLAAAEPPGSMATNEVIERHYTDEMMKDPMVRHWLVNQEVAALLFVAPGDGGTIFMLGHGGSGWLKRDEPDQLPIVKVSAESYSRITRILEKKIPVKLELDMQNKFYDNPDVFNIIAEIPGTYPKVKDEVVMMGAHFDSWTYGTGATDNAAGAAMLMEAMRILKALNLQPRRTIRIALWTGEEQGALGSEAYVAQHYRAQKGKSPAATPECDNFSAYFNLDGGTGKIRGIFAPDNAVARPVLDAWMAPFKDMGLETVSPWNIGGGDDNSFRKVGLPSFNFMQDPIEYESRTHHSSADVYERIQSDDLQFNSAVLAAFAWQAAQQDAKLPR